MQVSMMAEAMGVSKETKGLTCKAQHMKTKTKLEIRFTKEDRAKVDIFAGLGEDVGLLKLQAAPLVSVTVMVEGAQAIGRLVNRSIVAFGKIGIEISEMDWKDDSGEFTLTPVLEMAGNDLPPLMEVTARLVMRSLASISHTHHPLTLFDLKQAIGVTHDAKEGDEDAMAIVDWFNLRELIILEEVKAGKAEKAKTKRETAKAKRKVEKVAKAEAKAEGKTKAPEKNAPKAKPKAGKKAANLSHLTE